MVGQVPGAVLVLPLEHKALYAGPPGPPARYRGREAFGESYRRELQVREPKWARSFSTLCLYALRLQ